MQETNSSIKLNDLCIEDQQRLVGAFAWLVEEDKKQNPTLYQIKEEKND